MVEPTFNLYPKLSIVFEISYPDVQLAAVNVNLPVLPSQTSNFLRGLVVPTPTLPEFKLHILLFVICYCRPLLSIN